MSDLNNQPKARWYVIHVFSGAEDRVIAGIKEKAEKEGVADSFLELLAPKEEVTEVRRGVKKTFSRSFFSGYILVKMVLTDLTLHLVRNIDRVTGFLGVKDKPQALSDSEVEKLKGSVEASREDQAVQAYFVVGDYIKVTEGPFKGLGGAVETVMTDKNRLKVSAIVFGRPTPIEVDFSDVEKGQE